MRTLTDVDWSTIPAPEDDGAAAHLMGSQIPSITLPATDGTNVNLAALTGRTIIYAYPRTGRPDQPLPEGWDMIPGARGCTPQSCAFRDHFAELRTLGVNQIFGLSTQSSEYQKEAASRLHLPFLVLSDEALLLTRAMILPTFETSGMELLKRFTLIVDGDEVSHVFYPVFPPDEAVQEVIDWLSAHPV